MHSPEERLLIAPAMAYFRDTGPEHKGQELKLGTVFLEIYKCIVPVLMLLPL